MKWRGSGGWGTGASYSRMYDPKTVETINGEVVSVDKITPRKGMSYGVHLQVKTDKETLSVHLGPGWFIESQDVKIEPKDKIEIKGQRITLEGKPALIAAEVKKGNEVLKLRDDNGIPVWSGWRRKQIWNAHPNSALAGQASANKEVYAGSQQTLNRLAADIALPF